MVIGLRKIYITLDTGFADIKIDLASFGSDIAKIRVSHFSRSINDTTHDGNFYSWQVRCALADPFSDLLQFKKSAAAARTRNELCFRSAHPGGLKNIKTEQP